MAEDFEVNTEPVWECDLILDRGTEAMKEKVSELGLAGTEPMLMTLIQFPDGHPDPREKDAGLGFLSMGGRDAGLKADLLAMLLTAALQHAGWAGVELEVRVNGESITLGSEDE